jgi:uncharacterized protein (DUF302 family)
MDTNTGLVTRRSAFSVRETIDRLVNALTVKGLLVFARIDHGAGAAQVGAALRPTELLIFGNPKGGTPLMQDQQTVGIDLPIKALAWEDAEGAVWLTVNEVKWLRTRHGLGAGSEASLKAMAVGTDALIKAATER